MKGSTVAVLNTYKNFAANAAKFWCVLDDGLETIFCGKECYAHSSEKLHCRGH